MVLPYFDCSDVVVSNASTFLQGKLPSPLERCLRICLNVHRNNVNDLRNRAGVAKSGDRREMHVNNFMYRKLGRSGQLVEKKVTFKPEQNQHHVLMSPSLTTKRLSMVYIILVLFNGTAY